jgi:hypothetical protein
VDILVLSRDGTDLSRDVLAGLHAQPGVRCLVYRVVGRPRASDASRLQTIARARNRARELGTSPWVLFLDDDVALAPGCIAALVQGLQRLGPSWGAIAADYMGEGGQCLAVGHVAMGATLFRREALQSVRFRWQEGKCECRCCCEDLGRRGFRIGYWPAARATHMPRTDSAAPRPAAAAARILTAVDWYHVERFRRLFLPTLKASGNRIPVSVAAYGLAPTELRALASEALVAEVLERPASGHSPGVRRMLDFQVLLAPHSPSRIVAYWDAGDVLFQERLDALWRVAAENPDRLLVVREPVSHPANPALAAWTLRMPNLAVRRRVFDLLAPRPFLNGGFVAGSVATMRTFLQFGASFLRWADLLEEPASDQLALNYYCHTHPDRWREVDEGWNYCLAYRRRRVLRRRRVNELNGDVRLRHLPRVVTPAGRSVPVVHGNGHTLEDALQAWWSRTRPFP